MKRLYQFLPLLLLPVVFIFLGYSAGSPGGRTGSPGDNGNNCTACHTGDPQNASDWIMTDIPASGYIGGETYMITATGTHSGVGLFGFELTAEDQEGNKVGDFMITNTTETQLNNNDASVTHTAQGNTPAGDSKTWEFEWMAPDDVPGDITFYAAFNAANGNGNTGGDVVYLTDMTVSPDVTSIAGVEAEFAFYPNPTSGLVNFETPQFEDHAEVKVFNQAGQLIEKRNINSNTGQINLSDRAPGIYFVQFNNEKMHKLVVK